MASELIERMARAICAAGGRNPNMVTMGSAGVSYGDASLSWSQVHRVAWQEHVGQAVAVLIAMREPTACMIDAATTGAEVPYARQTWMDMVDAAIAEHGEG